MSNSSRTSQISNSVSQISISDPEVNPYDLSQEEYVQYTREKTLTFANGLLSLYGIQLNEDQIDRIY